MKTSRIIQFAVAALLVSVGCGLLLTGTATGFAAICFCSATFALYRRSELARPVRARELWITLGVLGMLAGLIVLANHFIPRSSDEQFVRRPVFIGIFWLLAMAGLVWRWSRERRLTDA